MIDGMVDGKIGVFQFFVIGLVALLIESFVFQQAGQAKLVLYNTLNTSSPYSAAANAAFAQYRMWTLYVIAWAVLMIILFGVSFFKFRKNPQADIFAKILIFSACGIFSVLGFVMTYFVLKGRGVTI